MALHVFHVVHQESIGFLGTTEGRVRMGLRISRSRAGSTYYVNGKAFSSACGVF